MNLEQVKCAFEQRGYTVNIFQTGEQAVKYLKAQTAGKSVTLGGSKTLEALGIYEALGEQAEVYWHWKGDGYHQTPDVYITSANALAQTGEIINIDGTGNRVSATLFGPKELFFVCGVNKLTPNLHAAIDRAQNVASTKNAMRLCQDHPERQTACTAAGGDRCYHCHAPQSICRAMVIHQGPMLSQQRCELVLIEEQLGF